MFGIYLISTGIVFVITTGIYFADFEATCQLNNRSANLSFSIFIGFLSGLISVIGLLLAITLTWGCKYGWKLPLPKLRIEELD